MYDTLYVQQIEPPGNLELLQAKKLVSELLSSHHDRPVHLRPHLDPSMLILCSGPTLLVIGLLWPPTCERDNAIIPLALLRQPHRPRLGTERCLTATHVLDNNATMVPSADRSLFPRQHSFSCLSAKSHRSSDQFYGQTIQCIYSFCFPVQDYVSQDLVYMRMSITNISTMSRRATMTHLEDEARLFRGSHGQNKNTYTNICRVSCIR